MKKILGLFKVAPQLFVYFCVATVIAQLVLLAVIKSKGTLTPLKINKVLAILYDVDFPLVEPARDMADVDVETASLMDIDEYHMLAQLDLTLRENAIDKGRASLTYLRNRLDANQERFESIKRSFDEQVAQKEKQAINQGLRQMQRSLESLPAKQAKDTLERMIKIKELPDVVNILRTMSADKRKRILGEFKTDDDQQKLRTILKEMLTGDVELIENAQKRMNEEFNSKRN